MRGLGGRSDAALVSGVQEFRSAGVQTNVLISGV